jgi:hypothetical protein
VKLARFFAVFAACATLFLNVAAPPKKAPSAKAKPPAGGTASGKAATKSKAAPKSAARSARRGRYRRAPKRVYAQPAQMLPDANRVKEIQQALVDRGYETPVDGVWGKPSEQALARFQADKKIDGRGKITSLSVISLGLGGPRRETASTAPAPENKR